MITMIARFKAKPGKESLLYEECRITTKLVRENEPGCMMYIPHIAKNNPAEIVLVSKYVDKEAFDNHLRSPHFKALAAKFGDLMVKVPDVQMLKELE